MDFRFGFCVKIPPQNRLQRSGNRNPGPQIQVLCFCYIENKKLIFQKFWLFLMSLTCIGSSGRLVGTISPKFRPNPRKPLPMRSKNITLLTEGGVITRTWGLKIFDKHTAVLTAYQAEWAESAYFWNFQPRIRLKLSCFSLCFSEFRSFCYIVLWALEKI